MENVVHKNVIAYKRTVNVGRFLVLSILVGNLANFVYGCKDVEHKSNSDIPHGDNKDLTQQNVLPIVSEVFPTSIYIDADNEANWSPSINNVPSQKLRRDLREKLVSERSISDSTCRYY